MESNSAKIINGSQIAAEIREELRQQIVEWIKKEGNRKPKLVTVLIGNDPASKVYVERKMEAAVNVGIECTLENYSTNISEKELLSVIERLNNDNEVDGFIVQLPLPNHINKSRIANAISCDKDVDGFNEKNIGKFILELDTFVPCAALSSRELIKSTGIETIGKNTVVVGTSKNFGLPIAIIMHNGITNNDACGMATTVTMCNINTPPQQLKLFCQNADILITVVGKPNLITADMVKPGACVIDVGITPVVDENGKNQFKGDVDFEGVKNVAGYITPVPGGIGPVTIAMLMKNTFKAAKLLAAKNK